MTIKFTGKYPKTSRKVTGYWSLDRAFTNPEGEIGMPTNTGYEIFGATHVGKSTFAWGLAGVLAQPKGIVLGDFEGYNPQFLERVLSFVGFDGEVHAVFEKEDEDQLDNLIKELTKKDFAVGILDSIAAISPLGEQSGELGEANMGRRAMLMAQFTRKALHLFRFSDEKEPKTILAINHWYPKIGSRGYNAPGGEVKEYLSTVRILVKRLEEFPDHSYILQGEVYKNRWGYERLKFYVFVVSGRGIHRGLSTMYDCIMANKAERLRGPSVKVGDEKFTFAKLVKEARAGNEEIFKPFYDALNNVELVVDTTSNDEEVEEETEE